VTHLYSGFVFLSQGRHENAIREIERASSLLPGFAGPTLQLARALASAGRREEAKRVINSVLARRAPSQYVPPSAVADAYVALGEKDQALAWLEKGYAERDSGLASLHGALAYDPLRSDPRFQDLLRRMNFPP